MIPEFEKGMQAMLVERTDRPGLLGVAVRGGHFVVPLPAGYNGQTSICVWKGYVLVAHPTLPPLKCDPTTGKFELIEDAHIEAQPGRHRLRTH